MGLNEGNIGRSVCPGFGKSTYGASLAKTSETILDDMTEQQTNGTENGNRYMRVLQTILSLSSDYFSATFYQTYFYYKPSKYPPFTETHFVTFLPSRETQINSLLLVSVRDTDK